MKHLLLRLVLLWVGLWAALSCTACTGTQVIRPLISVDGNTILHDGKPYAELRYYFTANLKDSPGEAYLFGARTQHRGIAIYYFRENTLAWIYPKRGLEEDIRRGNFTAHSDGEAKLGWVFDVFISPDGRFIQYKKPGLFWASTVRYSIEGGVHR